MPRAHARQQSLTDLNLTYRPQREWVEGRGLLVVAGPFFSGVGAGAWLFSVALDYDAGLVISVAVVAGLAGPAHLAFLGRWQRFWRAASRPQTSWISRGVWGLAIFLAGAIPHALPAGRASATRAGGGALSTTARREVIRRGGGVSGAVWVLVSLALARGAGGAARRSAGEL